MSVEDNPALRQWEAEAAQEKADALAFYTNLIATDVHGHLAQCARHVRDTALLFAERVKAKGLNRNAVDGLLESRIDAPAYSGSNKYALLNYGLAVFEQALTPPFEAPK